MGRLIVSILLFSAVLAACVAPHSFTPIPMRDADMYPDSQTKAGVAVAVDQMTYPQRAKQYFGVDLIKAQVLPINIIVSNHGQGRYVIKPSDVLLMHGKEVIDPVPMKIMAAAVNNVLGRMSQETASKVNAYFGKVMLKETVLAPRDNYQGIVFLKPNRPNADRSVSDEAAFSMPQLVQEGGFKIRIAVTDLETNERLHFGPFSVTAP